jgi:hypothetical protein
MDPLIIDPLVIDSNIEITTDLPLNHRKKKTSWESAATGLGSNR